MLAASLGFAYIIASLLFPEMSVISSARSNLDEKIKDMGRPFNADMMNLVRENENRKFPRICHGAIELNKTMGVSEDVYFLDKKVASAATEPCLYCVGFIFEMYMKALKKYMVEKGLKKIGNLDEKNINEFRKTFYGTKSRKTCVEALTTYRLGVEVPDISQAEPGDLIQFWRHNGTGHCVILTRLEKDLDGIRGFSYWSAQGTTNGVSHKKELFVQFGGQVDPLQTYIVRPIVPE